MAQVEAAIKTDQGLVDGARLNLTYAKITAPITGRAGLRQVDAGNMVHAADSGGIVVLTELDPVAVLFTLPEDSLQAVLRKVRGGATLAVEAWDRDLKAKLAGRQAPDGRQPDRSHDRDRAPQGRSSTIPRACSSPTSSSTSGC